jgi:UDP-glucose 4-epimerase
MNQFGGASVLITGGLGFIGSNLAIRLVELGAKVTVIDSLIPEYGGNLKNIEPVADKITVNISDVRDEHSMKYLIQGQDFLFNLAGQTSHLDSMENPYPDLDVNARAQLSILEACRKFNPTVRVVYASTRQVYGVPESLPVDERHPVRPVDVNGINKVAGEGYHIVYNNVYGIRTSVLRLTNTYGPRMRVKDARQTFLGIWIRRLLEGEPILVYGDGKQVRDFNYVDDMVNALLMAASNERAYGQIFNLGADDPTTLRDVAVKMVSLHSGSFEVVPFPNKLKAIDIGDYYGDYRRMRSQLGWVPQVTLEEGLKRSISYYKENLRFYI